MKEMMYDDEARTKLMRALDDDPTPPSPKAAARSEAPAPSLPRPTPKFSFDVFITRLANDPVWFRKAIVPLVLGATLVLIPAFNLPNVPSEVPPALLQVQVIASRDGTPSLYCVMEPSRRGVYYHVPKPDGSARWCEKSAEGLLAEAAARNAAALAQHRQVVAAAAAMRAEEPYVQRLLLWWPRALGLVAAPR